MLRVKLLHVDAKVPSRANPTDAGLDLYSLNDYTIRNGRVSLVRTGISVAIPAGYAGFIHPRSGLAVNKGVDRLAGVIDCSYRGEILVALTTISNDCCYIFSGDRVAQLVIQKVETWTPEVADELEETDRGDGGFGSTGR